MNLDHFHSAIASLAKYYLEQVGIDSQDRQGERIDPSICDSMILNGSKEDDFVFTIVFSYFTDEKKLVGSYHDKLMEALNMLVGAISRELKRGNLNTFDFSLSSHSFGFYCL